VGGRDYGTKGDFRGICKRIMSSEQTRLSRRGAKDSERKGNADVRGRAARKWKGKAVARKEGHSVRRPQRAPKEEQIKQRLEDWKKKKGGGGQNPMHCPKRRKAAAAIRFREKQRRGSGNRQENATLRARG